MVFSKLFGRGDKAKPKSQAAKPADKSGKPKASSNVQNDAAATNPKRKGRGGNRNRNRKKSDVSPAKPWSIDQFKVEPVEGKTRFHDLDLEESLVHGIADLGFQYASPIQAQSLPFTLAGNDVVGKAQTGTGKTAAFLITIINDLLTNKIEGERFVGEARALVVAPTRELVMQIADDAVGLCKHTGLSVHTLVGGVDYQKQRDKLNTSLCDILVATPGRLIDFMGSRDVYLDQVEVLVLDEADRMLDMGFIPQVRRIVRATPHRENRQTLLFSATFSNDVLNLADQWTYDHTKIEIEPESVATDNVDQKVYLTATDDKFTLLYNIVNQPEASSVIVFANRRDTVRTLYEKLEAAGFSVGQLSGDVAQAKRIKTLENFKSGKTKIMVATDVAGRGIHIDGISHVVNYTLPEESEDYVHRIGRTGRAGATGTSISFACEDDSFLLPNIEELLERKLDCEQPPEQLLKMIPEELAAKIQSSNRRRSSRGPRGNSRSGGHRGHHRR